MHKEDYARNTCVLHGAKPLWDALTPGLESRGLQVHVNHYQAALVPRELLGLTLEDFLSSFVGEWHTSDQLSIRTPWPHNRVRQSHARSIVVRRRSGCDNDPGKSRAPMAPWSEWSCSMR